MKIFQFTFTMITFPVRFCVYQFQNALYELRLWGIQRQTMLVIGWAKRYPNEHNLGNLIIWRHQLRQARYRMNNVEHLEDSDFWDTLEGKRLMGNFDRNIGRLDMAIRETELVL